MLRTNPFSVAHHDQCLRLDGLDLLGRVSLELPGKLLDLGDENRPALGIGSVFVVRPLENRRSEVIRQALDLVVGIGIVGVLRAAGNSAENRELSHQVWMPDRYAERY